MSHTRCITKERKKKNRALSPGRSANQEMRGGEGCSEKSRQSEWAKTGLPQDNACRRDPTAGYGGSVRPFALTDTVSISIPLLPRRCRLLLDCRLEMKRSSGSCSRLWVWNRAPHNFQLFFHHNYTVVLWQQLLHDNLP